MSDLEFNEQKENSMGEAFTEGETIDGGAPYEFDKSEGDVNYRSAETGRFVSEEEAEAHPETTVKETVDPTPEEMDAMVDKAVSLIHESRGVNPKGSPTKLNKRSLVMSLHDDQHTDNYAYFEHQYDELVRTDGYYMPLEIWDDFGRPDVITVVVYPKDMLNS